jgi:ABC-type glutathione transport system ATPase component
MDPELLLRACDLRVVFHSGSSAVYAVNGVDVSLGRSERLGIAGESGSGKRVTCKALLGLLPDYADVRGSVRMGAHELIGASAEELRSIRGRRVGYVFQDSRSALDPYVSIGTQLEERAAVHGVERTERRRLAIWWLERVGLDVSTQVRLIELLRSLCREESLALVLVSHNLGVISQLCDRVIVMYGGLVVESGSARLPDGREIDFDLSANADMWVITAIYGEAKDRALTQWPRLEGSIER